MADLQNIKCPTCGQRGAWFDGRFGPFCSERCRLVDLGRWFDQENRISEPLKPSHFEPYGDLPPGANLDQPED